MVLCPQWWAVEVSEGCNAIGRERVSRLSLFIEKPRKLALAGLFIWIGAVVRKAGTSRSDGYNPSSNADSWRVMIVWLLRRS